jgi:putative hydrolase of the HAD superfamily
MWFRSAARAVEELAPHWAVSADDLNAALKTGFPWHRPDVPHPELSDPEAWWTRVTSRIAEALCTLGCTQAEARLISLRVRELIVDATGYEVFADVEPALRRLSEAGWIQAVVSNHIPELAYLLDNLGLAPYLARVYTSAIVGYEKPHAGFLGRVLDDVPWPEPVWVVGDSVEADCLPARAHGCRAILVRTLDDRFQPRAAELGQAVDLIMAQGLNPVHGGASLTS